MLLAGEHTIIMEINSFHAFNRWKMIETFKCTRAGCKGKLVLNLVCGLKKSSNHFHFKKNLAKRTQENIINTYALINASNLRIIAFISKTLKGMDLFDQIFDFDTLVNKIKYA